MVFTKIVVQCAIFKATHFERWLYYKTKHFSYFPGHGAQSAQSRIE
jgi:hypothetical protein